MFLTQGTFNWTELQAQFNLVRPSQVYLIIPGRAGSIRTKNPKTIAEFNAIVTGATGPVQYYRRKKR